MSDQLYKDFARWIDAALSQPLPGEIAAFNFNLYEGSECHELELIGAPTYSPQCEDWACDDIFMSSSPRFRLPHSVVGAGWESGLASSASLILRFINSDRPGAVTLRRHQAVAVGFVDGNLQVVWAAA